MTDRDAEMHFLLSGLQDWCDRDSEATVRRTIARLPEDVRVFAVDECVYISAGFEHGRAQAIRLPEQMSDAYIIVLCGGEQEESVVAHEIAHAWLKHPDAIFSTNPHLESDDEAEARALTMSWGFRGLGADIDGHAQD